MTGSVPQVDIEATVHTAGSVSVGGSVAGEITLLDGGRRDHDWFAVTLQAGKTYRIDVKGADTGDGTLANPILVGVYDASGGFVGGTGDDNGGTGRNSLKAFTPGADGTYYVAARAHGTATGTYTVAVDEVPADDFTASVATTGIVAVGGSATGEIQPAVGSWRDHDWFAVTLEAGTTYWIDVKGAETGDGTLANPILVGVYDASGGFIGGTGDDDGGTGRNSRKEFTPDTSGTYYVAVRAHGVNTGTYTVAVDDVPSDDFVASVLTTGTVAVGGSATGDIESQRDHDWFAVTLEAGKTYRIDVKGASTEDDTLWNPILVGVYDASGGFIGGTGDDNGGTGLNSLKVFTPEADGTYYVAVRTHGTATGTYTVAVDEVPADDFAASVLTTGTVAVGGSATGEIGPEINSQRDHDWFAVTLEAGKTYRIDVKGLFTGDGTLGYPVLDGVYDATGGYIDGTFDYDSGVGGNSLKLFTPEAGGTYYVAVREHHHRTGTYTVAVEEVPTVAVEEVPDDFSASVATTGTVAVGGSVTGEITLTASPRDHDWFAVTLEAGKTYRIDVKGADTGDGTLDDPVLAGVYDASGVLIGGTGDGNGGSGRNSLKAFTPDADGTYYVAARAHGTATGTYTVAVEEVPDDFSASVATTGTVAVGGSATGEIEPTLGSRRDHDWFAVTLEAGKTYRIDVKGADTGDGTLANPILVGVYDASGVLIGGTFDDNGGTGRNSLTVFTPGADGTYHVAARAHGAATGTYTVAVDEVPADDFSASVATTGTVAVGGSATGEITLTASPHDQDWFAVTLEAGKLYRIDVKGADTGDGTLANPILAGVYDASGVLIGGTFDDNGGTGRNSLRLYSPAADGTYHVAARANGHATGTYTVAVEEVFVAPADDFSASVATTGTVAVGGSATGEIGPAVGSQRDHDWFAVTLKAGKTYRIDVKGADTGDGTLADPILDGVYDASGGYIDGTRDDNTGTGKNSLKLFSPDADGTYYVAARAHGFNTGTYTVAAVDEVAVVPDDFSASVATTGTVTVGGSATGEIGPAVNSQRDHDWFAVTLEAGKTYRIDIKGYYTGHGTLGDPVLVGVYDASGGIVVGTGDDNSGTGKNSLKFFVPETTGTYYVAARGYGDRTGTYTVAVDEVAGDDYSASVATTGTVAVGGSATGKIGPEVNSQRDHDWFAVTLEAGKTYRIDVKGEDTGDGTLANPILDGVYDASGGFIAGTRDDNGGVVRNSLKLFTPDADGTYYVAARGLGTTAGTYTVAVDEVPDDFSGSVWTTGTVAVGGSATGEIGSAAGSRHDHDWFAVTLEAGKTYRIDVKGADTGDGTLLDPILVGVYDASGGLIGGTGDDDGGTGRNSLKVFAPDAAGTYYVAARAHGANTGTYTVAVEEVPDDYSASVATTSTVAVGGSATGEITLTAGPRDHDWFAVTLEAGKTYRIDVKGASTGDGTLANPILVGVYDASGGFVGGTGDDDGGTGRNSLKAFTPEADGTYYVAARAHGAATGTYTVAVEEVPDDYSASVATTGTVAVGGSATGEITLAASPHDHDWFAVTLKAGKTYRIDVKGAETGDGTLADPILVGVYDASGGFIGGTRDDNTGTGRNSLKLFSPDADGIYHVAARAHGANTGTYTVAVEEVAVVPDDFSASVATTGTVAVGGSVTGAIEPAVNSQRDHDWFAVTLEAGKLYRIDVKGAETGDGTLGNPILAGVYDASGGLIGGTGNDNGGVGGNSLKVFTPAADGTYYVAVRAHGAAIGTYTVAVDEVSADDYAASATLAAVEMGDVRVVEGGVAVFTVRLSHAATGEVTVAWSVGGSATAGDDYDTAAGTGVLTFAAGERKKTIEVRTVDDAVAEGDETLTVTLSNPSGATLGSVVSATVTVADDDNPPVPADGEPQAPPQDGEGAPRGASVAGTMADDTLVGTAGADAIDCLDGNDVAQGFAGNDRLWGGLGADVLHGDAGDDRLWGGKGRDELHGGVGKDHLYGGRGNDMLHGGRLADRLHGDAGNDVLSGGAGRDLFVYGDADFGRDRIVDFEDGTDLLKFTGSGLRWGDLSVSNNRQGHAVVRVESADSSIVLEGVDASLIDQNDFIF